VNGRMVPNVSENAQEQPVKQQRGRRRDSGSSVSDRSGAQVRETQTLDSQQ